MPLIEILDKATSTIDLTVNNQINDANVVEFSPENTPPIEILDRATENSRSNQSCMHNTEFLFRLIKTRCNTIRCP
jgi:DNA-directed RNA polymerase specialized sigma54-like protein